MRIVFSGILLIACFTGCRSLADELRGSVATGQARRSADWSWQQSIALYDGVTHIGPFSDGYKAGFTAAAAGSLGGHPTPPASLRAATDHVGVEQQQAWYDGYSHGVLAAQHEQSRQHSTLDTTIVHEGEIREGETIVIHEGGNVPPGTQTTPSNSPFSAAPAHLPPTGLGPGTTITIEENERPVESLQPAPSEPSFVPPPPAPPMEETRVGRQSSTQKVSHATSSKKNATAASHSGAAPALSLGDAAVNSSPAPATQVAPQIPKKNRAEWQMPVLNAKAVWGL